jgi:hypothetical protein
MAMKTIETSYIPKPINSKGSLMLVGMSGTKLTALQLGVSDDDFALIPTTAVDNLGDDVYMKMCFVTQAGDSGTTVEELDVTTLCDTERSFIGGYPDHGTLSLTANFVPGAPTFRRLQEILNSSKPGNFCQIFPDDGLGRGEARYFYRGVLTNMGRSSAVGSHVTAPITIRKSGKPLEELPEPTPASPEITEPETESTEGATE